MRLHSPSWTQMNIGRDANGFCSGASATAAGGHDGAASTDGVATTDVRGNGNVCLAAVERGRLADQVVRIEHLRQQRGAIAARSMSSIYRNYIDEKLKCERYIFQIYM